MQAGRPFFDGFFGGKLRRLKREEQHGGLQRYMITDFTELFCAAASEHVQTVEDALSHLLNQGQLLNILI